MELNQKKNMMRGKNVRLKRILYSNAHWKAQQILGATEYDVCWLTAFLADTGTLDQMINDPL